MFTNSIRTAGTIVRAAASSPSLWTGGLHTSAALYGRQRTTVELNNGTKVNKKVVDLTMTLLRRVNNFGGKYIEVGDPTGDTAPIEVNGPMVLDMLKYLAERGQPVPKKDPFLEELKELGLIDEDGKIKDKDTRNIILSSVENVGLGVSKLGNAYQEEAASKGR